MYIHDHPLIHGRKGHHTSSHRSVSVESPLPGTSLPHIATRPWSQGPFPCCAELPVPLAFPTCTAVCRAQFYHSETPCCTGHCHVQLIPLIAVGTSNFVVDSKGKNTAEQVC